MFLLLIFFMVSSVFRTSTGIDITLPTASTASDQQDAPYEIFIEASGDIVFRDAPAMNLGTLEEELRTLLEEEPDAPMALSADEEADYKDFIAVIDLARRLGAEQLIIRTKLERRDTDTGDSTNQ